MLFIFAMLQVALLVTTQIFAIRFLGVTNEHEQFLLLQGLFVIVSTSLGTVSYNYWLPKYVAAETSDQMGKVASYSRHTTVIYYLLPLLLIFFIVATGLYSFFDFFEDIKSQFLPLVTIVAVSSIFTTLVNPEVALLRASGHALFVEVVSSAATFVSLCAILTLGENLSILYFSFVICLKVVVVYAVLFFRNLSFPFFTKNPVSEFKNFNSTFVPNAFVRGTQFLDKFLLFSLGPGALIVWNFVFQIISCCNTLIDKGINSRSVPVLLRLGKDNQSGVFRYVGVTLSAYIAIGLLSGLIWYISHEYLIEISMVMLSVDLKVASMIVSAAPAILVFVIVANIGVHASALMLNHQFYYVAGFANLTAAFIFVLAKLFMIPVLTVNLLISINAIQILATALFYFRYIQSKGGDSFTSINSQ